MKILGTAFIVVGLLLCGIIWPLLYGLTHDDLVLVRRMYAGGYWMVAIGSCVARAGRLSYIGPASLVVIGALLLAWARDRRRLRSYTKSDATPII